LAVTRRARAERLTMPLARDVVKDLAVEHGACIRPLQLRRTDLETGAVDQVLLPCGHTLAGVCPACARRAKTLRAAQAAPDHPAAARRRTTAPAQDRGADGGQGLHLTGRQEVPPVDVPHPDLPQLRARPGRRHPGRPGRLRLHPGGRDALHFAALFDRFVQNLRRFLGYDVQYFAAVEPQRRLAPPAGPAIAATNGNRG
jgi:hypothetical protein